MRCSLVAALVVLILPQFAAAQIGELQPGVRVRLSAPGIVAEDYVGTLLQVTRDTLVVAGANLAQARIPRAGITSLELSRGKSRSDGAIEGMKWGIPIMTGLGLIVAAVPDNLDTTRCYDVCPSITGGTRVAFVVLAAASGALYGAGIGALIGREHWEEFDVSLRPTGSIDAGRIGIGLRYAF